MFTLKKKPDEYRQEKNVDLDLGSYWILDNICDTIAGSFRQNLPPNTYDELRTAPPLSNLVKCI